MRFRKGCHTANRHRQSAFLESCSETAHFRPCSADNSERSTESSVFFVEYSERDIAFHQAHFVFSLMPSPSPLWPAFGSAWTPSTSNCLRSTVLQLQINSQRLPCSSPYTVSGLWFICIRLVPPKKRLGTLYGLWSLPYTSALVGPLTLGRCIRAPGMSFGDKPRYLQDDRPDSAQPNTLTTPLAYHTHPPPLHIPPPSIASPRLPASFSAIVHYYP